MTPTGLALFSLWTAAAFAPWVFVVAAAVVYTLRCLLA
jgi:hypothetical protein